MVVNPWQSHGAVGNLAWLSLLAVFIMATAAWSAGIGDGPNGADAEPDSSKPQSLDQNDGQREAGNTVAPLERIVSLSAKQMPLRDVFAELSRQAGVPLELDEKALQAAKVDLDAPVTIEVEQEPLWEAVAGLLRLVNKGSFTGAFWDIRAGKLVISTLIAEQERITRQLPDWLKPLYNHGLVADVDDAGDVTSITASSVVTDELLAQIAKLPRLRQLTIETTTDLTETGLAHLAGMSELEKLSLYSVKTEGRGLGDEAIRAVRGLKRLRDLSLGQCGTTDSGVRLLEEMQQLTRLELRQEGRLTDAALVSVGKLKGLKHLDLSSYVGADYGSMRFSAEGIRHLTALKKLEELHLVGHAVPSDALVFDRLTSLSLGGPGVDNACAARIAKCRDLKSLELSYTPIGDTGIGQLAALPALDNLKLDSHVVTDEGIAYLKSLKNLQHVNLRASRVTDASIAHLTEIKTLTRLDLHGSGRPGSVVGARFSRDSLKRLKELPKLRTLWLTNFQIGDYLGLKELAQLRELSLTMCDITPFDVGALEEALPNTIIHAVSGLGLIRPRK